MPSKLRSDFMKATLRAGVASLAVAFALANTQGIIENTVAALRTEEVAEPIKTKVPSPIEAAAEILAAARDDLDRIEEVKETGKMLRSGIGGAHKTFPAPRSP